MRVNILIATAIAISVIIAGMAYDALSNQVPATMDNTTEARGGGSGTVSGIVTDQNKIGIPNANVTLWNVRWNNAAGGWENTDLARIRDNPQLSNNGSSGAAGMYTFYTVPWSAYNVTAEKDGHAWYSLLLLGPGDAYSNATYVPGSEYGTATHNIAIPDYSF